MSDVRVGETCMQHWQCLSCQRRARLCAGERGCVPVSATSSLLYHFSFLKHNHSAASHHHHRRCETQLSYPWKLHACRANNNYLPYFYFLRYVFGIGFSCIIQNKSYNSYDNIFLYNYLQQMQQIIHFSPVGCFTTARSKSMQKNREVSWVKHDTCFFNIKCHC